MFGNNSESANVFDRVPGLIKAPTIDRNICKKLYAYIDKHFVDSLGIGLLNQILQILNNETLSEEEKIQRISRPNSVRNLCPDFSAQKLWIDLDDGLVYHLLRVHIRLYSAHAKTAESLLKVLSHGDRYAASDQIPDYQKFMVASLLLLSKLRSDREKQK